MAKKKQIKKIFESASIESADAHPDRTESVHIEQQGEPSLPVVNTQEVIETPPGDEESASEKSFQSDETKVEITQAVSDSLQDEPTLAEANPQDEESSVEMPLMPATTQETPAEDVLDEVRRSLIEEEIDKSAKEAKWWRRIGKRNKRVEPEKPTANVEIDLPTLSEPIADSAAPEQKPEPEEQLDQIDNLIEMLAIESEEATVDSPVAPEVEIPPVPEPEIDFEKLKEQAFQARPPEEETESLSDVRSVALEDGEEVFVEVQSQVTDPLEERLSAFENALRPYRWYVNSALAIFGVVVVVIVSLLMFNVYQQSRPQPTKAASNLPYPTAVSLPGGWSFQLGRGSLQNGKWAPQGAEWLEGTEVCRWVALPWSRQLEAVIRTLNPKDPVELVMSNNDKLVYEVYSIRQLTLQQMQELDSNSPCLLIILTQSDSEERWVLTALP